MCNWGLALVSPTIGGQVGQHEWNHTGKSFHEDNLANSQATVGQIHFQCIYKSVNISEENVGE